MEIYDVPMKFARKLIHGRQVHPCYEPVKVLHQDMVLSEGMLDRWLYLHGSPLIQVSPGRVFDLDL